jgi:hypothetical protein
MDVRQHLTEIAHIEPLAAAGAFHEVIGFGFGYVIGAASVWRHNNHGRRFLGLGVKIKRLDVDRLPIGGLQPNRCMTGLRCRSL